FSATYADRERDSAEKPVLSRLKEQMFECGSADSYNVCEWASIDRLERGKRGGSIAALRAAVAAQAILTFDEKLQTPRDLADDPINGDFYKYAHHVAAAAKGALQPRELLRAFVHYKHVDYYDPALFNRAYDWMKARGMTEGQSQHAALVVGSTPCITHVLQSRNGKEAHGFAQ